MDMVDGLQKMNTNMPNVARENNLNFVNATVTNQEAVCFSLFILNLS